MPRKTKAAPAPAHRPPRVALTSEVISEVVNLIEQGSFPLSAARHVGIPKRTWYSWLADGERGEGPTSLLLHAVERAKGRLATKLYATIHRAAVSHEEPAHDKQGNVIMVANEKGQMTPLMVTVPGDAGLAIRMLESLSPDEMLRQAGGSPVGGGGAGNVDDGTPIDFAIVYIESNRDPKEMAEINRQIEERASRGSSD